MDDELREILRRADRHPDRGCALRRTAFERILELAHSDNSALKRLATQKIKDYFVDFPDLKERAINTIYDLCEDPDQNIRICGYTAITSVSRVDKTWIVQNADVLVQLLQNDDEREVTVVKKALQEHIDIEPSGTLRVLCDQCTVDGKRSDGDSSMDVDDEELVLRRRLRTLVLRFLAEKYNVCISRVVKSAEVEEVLFNGLVKAIPQATLEEINLIVKEILVTLPTLSTSSDRCNSLLDAIVQMAVTTFQFEIGTTTSRSSIPQTLSSLELALSVITNLSKQAVSTRAHPEHLLRVFFSSPEERISLSTTRDRLEPFAEERLALLIARAWQACSDALQKADIARKRAIAILREEVAKEAGYLLEVLSRTKSVDNFQGLLSILKAVQSHASSNRASSTTLLQSLTNSLKTAIEVVSVVPPSMSSSRQEALFDSKADINAVRTEVGQLCRELLQAGAPRPKSLGSSSTVSSASGASATTKGKGVETSDGTMTNGAIGRNTKGNVTINRPVPSMTPSMTASTSGKRKLGDTDTEQGSRTTPTLAERLGATTSSAPRSTGSVHSTSDGVSIFGAAARLGGKQNEKTGSDTNAMDVDSELSPRSSKRAKNSRVQTTSDAPLNLLARLSGSGTSQPLRPSRSQSSPSIPRRQGGRESPAPSLLDRLRNNSSTSIDTSSSASGDKQGIRLRGAASVSNLVKRDTDGSATGSISGADRASDQVTHISILGASANSSASGSDGLQIRGAASRLAGVNLMDRLL